MCRSPHARSLGAYRAREVDCTRAKDPRWYAPAGFSQGPAYKSRPGLFTRLGQIGVLGSAGGSMGPQGVSRRVVSRDSQRLRHWAPDEPVDDLLIKVDCRLPSCSSSCLPRARSSYQSRSQKPSCSRRQTRQSSRFFLQPIAPPRRSQFFSRQIHHCLSFVRSPRSPLVVSIQQKSSLDTQAQLLPRQMVDSTLRFSSSYRRSHTRPQANPLPADGRQTSFSPFFAFLSARSFRKADRKTDTAVPCTAIGAPPFHHRLPGAPAVLKPTGSSLQFHFLL